MPIATPPTQIRPEIAGEESEIERLLIEAFGGTAETKLAPGAARDALGRRFACAAGFAPFLPPG